MSMISFNECANYRGALQAKEEGGKFFWRVDCDLDDDDFAWSEIPGYLWEALKKYHDDTSTERQEQAENDNEADA